MQAAVTLLLLLLHAKASHLPVPVFVWLHPLPVLDALFHLVLGDQKLLVQLLLAFPLFGPFQRPGLKMDLYMTWVTDE